jgi:UTP--glucose-1-phosphate uridylyltransferase
VADDILTDYEPGVTADLAGVFASSCKSQLLVTEIDGSDISK